MTGRKRISKGIASNCCRSICGRHLYQKHSWKIPIVIRTDKVHIKQYMVILMPLLICEFFWSLGENVYASIYGHVGTKAFAAMTLTNPLQALVMGALSGVSQAAGVMIGKRLGLMIQGVLIRIPKE